MPMFTTLRMRRPVKPFHSPERRRSAKALQRHHVGAVDDDALALLRAERHVQHRALLGGVDLLAFEHRVDLRAQAALLGEGEEQPDRLLRHPLFGEVGVDAGRLDGELLRPLGVSPEELAQVQVLHLLAVFGQRLPGRSGFAHGAGLYRRRRP
jgi:hypothetical protein